MTSPPQLLINRSTRRMRRPGLLMACVSILGIGYVGYIIGVTDYKFHLGAVAQRQLGLLRDQRTYTARYPTRTCSSNLTYVDFGATLTPEQTERVEECMINYKTDSSKGLQQDGVNLSIRYRSHTYLNNNSFVIEAGGHLGKDVEALNSRYHPGVYVVLEPVLKFYKILVEKFKMSPNIVFYNFGVDTTDGTFAVDNKINDAVSVYRKTGVSDDTLHIMGVPKLFDKLMVTRKHVDLITLNCEGCEYAVLDFLLSTDYIHHFQNIQYQSHRISGICHPVKRFCWYQEMLSKTHKLVFQHKFWWESWTEKGHK